jgi:D-ribose pyranose/furanose isomerase RbsD
MKSLFHIESEYLALASALEQGELTPELETALAINEQELQVKAVAYAYVIKDAEANTEAIDNEIARLTSLKQAEKRKAERLKEAISNAMQMYGITEVKTATLKL